MSKIALLTIVGVVLLAAVTVLNIAGVNASEETKFVQVSVLAQSQADYGVDEGNRIIPAVSPAIIEDKVHDITPPKTVKTIKYTTLPAGASEPANKDKEKGKDQYHPPAADKSKPTKDHESNAGGNREQNAQTTQNNNGGNNGNASVDQAATQGANNSAGQNNSSGSQTTKPVRKDRSTKSDPTSPAKKEPLKVK